MPGRVEQEIRVAGGAGFIGANFILDWLRVNGGAVLDWTSQPARRVVAGRPKGCVCCPCPAATILHRPRALNSRLGNDKPGQTFGLRLQDWRSALTLCLEAMKT